MENEWGKGHPVPKPKGRGYMPAAGRSDWGTPAKVFDALAARFGPFDLDPCGSADAYASQRCGRHFTVEDDGLRRPWPGRVFVNPPYGRPLNEWVRKCWLESQGVAEIVVALLPARTDTRWFHRYVMGSVYADRPVAMRAAEVHFVPGRLSFAGADGPATFPSVVVVWRSTGAPIEDAGAEQRSLFE
jgi:site-specific DNA-methyltransferase (adenine-specific)